MSKASKASKKQAKADGSNIADVYGDIIVEQNDSGGDEQSISDYVTKRDIQELTDDMKMLKEGIMALLQKDRQISHMIEKQKQKQKQTDSFGLGSRLYHSDNDEVESNEEEYRHIKADDGIIKCIYDSIPRYDGEGDTQKYWNIL